MKPSIAAVVLLGVTTLQGAEPSMAVPLTLRDAAASARARAVLLVPASQALLPTVLQSPMRGADPLNVLVPARRPDYLNFEPRLRALERQLKVPVRS